MNCLTIIAIVCFLPFISGQCDENLETCSCKDVNTLKKEMKELLNAVSPHSCKGRINGEQTLSSGLKVLCHNGWIVFQQNNKDETTFDKSWNEFKGFFGSFSGNFWLGNDNIHNLTKQGGCRLRIDLWDLNDVYTYAEYRQIIVNDENDKYRLRVSGYDKSSSTAADGVTTAAESSFLINNMFFTTYDRDNDNNPKGNCASLYKAGFWYNWCASSPLNNHYGDLSWNIQANNQAAYAKAKRKSSKMMIKCD